MGDTGAVDGLIVRMRSTLDDMSGASDVQRFFLSTYLRTTEAVRDAIAGGDFFRDSAWVATWDVAFAGLYLDALDSWRATGTAPGPWQVAFDATSGPRLPPLRHLLLGMNAHINYDLPQALLATITSAQFDDADLVARRAADHARIDDILVRRVAAEDTALKALEESGDRTLLDRLLTPFNQAGTRRFLIEARRKVWRNARLLDQARRSDALDERLDELAKLSRDRVADLRRPGQVILRLALRGFGVTLSDSKDVGH